MGRYGSVWVGTVHSLMCTPVTRELATSVNPPPPYFNFHISFNGSRCTVHVKDLSALICDSPRESYVKSMLSPNNKYQPNGAWNVCKCHFV